ncbi:MAG: (Fe-S)-binding protein [Elusimicrobium sp.]|jgi:glycolate oxidase iron-sulfur subunit|nr:(Fe-S)-binding protein [Elusimicrobium sp.]
MENFRTPKNFLFKEGFEDLHLHTIFTQLGQKTVYDSAAQCNKCAYCSRTCPAQLDTAREDKGPRARNILLRFIMENKIDRKKNVTEIKDALSCCMLCGACTKECFAKVPTHEHVLELERVYGRRKLPLSRRLKNKIISLNPFDLKREIKKTEFGGKGKGAFFLPSFEAEFSEVKSAVNMLRAISKICGGARVLRGESGMNEYVYSGLPAARKTALKLINEYFAADGGGKIITDSMDIFNFVKKYPQLFWQTENFDKAQKFADNIYFIADILPSLPKTKNTKKIIFTKTAAFAAEDKIFESSIKLLAKNSQNFCPSWEGDNYPLPPLGYEYIKPGESARYLRRKVEYIAAAQGDAVVCVTLAQKRQLNKSLKKYYPKCKAVFIGDLYADK